jgi:hypothetical protein
MKWAHQRPQFRDIVLPHRNQSIKYNLPSRIKFRRLINQKTATLKENYGIRYELNKVVTVYNYLEIHSSIA